MQYGAHCLMQHVHGYIRAHLMPPLGKYLHHTPLAAARDINFGTHKQDCGGEDRSSEASSKKAQNAPSNQLINHNWGGRACTHFVLSNLVRGQKLRKLLRMMLVKKWALMISIAVKLLTA